MKTRAAIGISVLLAFPLHALADGGWGTSFLVGIVTVSISLVAFFVFVFFAIFRNFTNQQILWRWILVIAVFATVAVGLFLPVVVLLTETPLYDGATAHIGSAVVYPSFAICILIALLVAWWVYSLAHDESDRN